MVPILLKEFGELAEIRYIPLAVDDHWYQVKNDSTSVATQKWLSVLRVTPKKIGPLFDWGKDFFIGNRELHLFGPVQEPVNIPSWVHYHGPIKPLELANDWFPRAAGLISLSQHDEGCPQIMLEAMAAALPIIASDITGHSDAVTHMHNGFLVSSSAEFRTALTYCDDIEFRLQMGLRGKQKVINTHGNWKSCASRYETAYSELILRNAQNG
jgi:glycosyltransferase involved in cell wall biosynthesis